MVLLTYKVRYRAKFMLTQRPVLPKFCLQCRNQRNFIHKKYPYVLAKTIIAQTDTTRQ